MRHKNCSNENYVTKKKRIVKQIVLSLYLSLKLRKLKRNRFRNQIRERSSVLSMIHQKSDAWFEKSYHLPRLLFYNLLELINPILESKNKQLAWNSSGSPLVGEILLAATLRYLAGASYIDLVDLYKLPEKCHVYFWRTLEAIDQVLDNIKIPSTPGEWRQLSEEWNEKMRVKLSNCYFPGTVLSLDGIVIETRKPYPSEVNGDIVGNFNRKGYFGMVAMSAVDAHGRFVYSELGWSGSTNDSVAYRCTELAKVVQQNEIPKDLHIVADEAFCACSPQILTPYSRRSLRELNNNNEEEYLLKRSFNYLLSYQRCTVERLFGLLVRKFLILSQRFDCKRERVKLIFRVCCKLLNLCITDWLQNQNFSWDLSWKPTHDENSQLSDNAILHQLLNTNPPPRQPNFNNQAFQGPNRDKLALKVRDLGFKFERKTLPSLDSLNE